MISAGAIRGKARPRKRHGPADGASMCALCGVLGGKGHWSDSASAPAVFAARTEPQTRLRERQTRVRILNIVLRQHGVAVKDWSGNAYLLTGRTGRTAIVDTIGEIWPAAEQISGRLCDPLDERYLSTLAGRPT
jgi:hypothetical protein